MTRWTVFGKDISSGTVRVVLAVFVGTATIAYGAYSYTAQSSAIDSTEAVETTMLSTATSVTEDNEQRSGYKPQATFKPTPTSKPLTTLGVGMLILLTGVYNGVYRRYK